MRSKLSDQALVKKCFAAILVLNFLSNLRKETKFSWIVAKVEKVKHCKQNEKCPGRCNVILYFGVFLIIIL